MEAYPAETQIFNGFQHILLPPKERSMVLRCSNSHKFGLLVNLRKQSTRNQVNVESLINILNILRKNVIQLRIESVFIHELLFILAETLVFHDSVRVIIKNADVVTGTSNNLNADVLTQIEDLVD
jgi:hypothetical protein